MQPAADINFRNDTACIAPLEAGIPPPPDAAAAHSLANSAWCSTDLLAALLAACDHVDCAGRVVRSLFEAAAATCPEALLVGVCSVPASSGLHPLVKALVTQLGPPLVIAPRSGGASTAVLGRIAALNLPALQLLFQETYEADSSSMSQILNIIQVRGAPHSRWGCACGASLCRKGRPATNFERRWWHGSVSMLARCGGGASTALLGHIAAVS